MMYWTVQCVTATDKTIKNHHHHMAGGSCFKSQVRLLWSLLLSVLKVWVCMGLFASRPLAVMSHACHWLAFWVSSSHCFDTFESSSRWLWCGEIATKSHNAAQLLLFVSQQNNSKFKCFIDEDRHCWTCTVITDSHTATCFNCYVRPAVQITQGNRLKNVFFQSIS